MRHKRSADTGLDSDARTGSGGRKPTGTRISIRPWTCRPGYRIVVGTGPERKVVGSAKTVEEAVRKRDELAQRLTSGDGIDGRPPQTVGDLLQRWVIARASKRSVADSTAATYRFQGAALIRGLGTLSLFDLTREAVERYAYGRLDAGKSPATVHGEITILRMALGHANSRGWCRVDVGRLCDDLALGQPPEKRVLDPVEYASYFAAADAWDRKWKIPPYLGNAVRIAAFCGLREGEVGALTWARMDWKNRLLSISDDRGHRTKNRKSRVVGVPKELAERLRTQRQEQGAELKPGAAMFPSRDGDIRSDTSWFREALGRACAKAGLAPITFHELRHTFVTNSLRATKDLAGVSKTAGHHDPGYTARRYGHLVPEWSLAIADATADYVRDAAGAGKG